MCVDEALVNSSALGAESLTRDGVVFRRGWSKLLIVTKNSITSKTISFENQNYLLKSINAWYKYFEIKETEKIDLPSKKNSN